MRVLRMALVAFVVALVFAPSAFAERTKPNIHFFSGQQSHANWTTPDSVDPNRMSILFDVGPATSIAYAGFDLNHVEGTPPPANEPGFFHKEDRDGQSGGSPRLVFLFSNGNMYLRPDQWSQSWQEVGNDNDDGNWDVNGGACGFKFDVTYAEALQCFPNALLVDVFMVSDSTFLYPTGYLNWVDQLQYSGFTYSHAGDNNNSQATPPLP